MPLESTYLNELVHIRKTHIIILAIIFGLAGAAALFSQPKFSERTDLGEIDNSGLNELSGLAASRKSPGVLWTHNDSDNLAVIYAINDEGRYIGEVALAGAENRDFEDIAIGPGPEPGFDYIYIADIGDNKKEYQTKYIYRFKEPDFDRNQNQKGLLIEDYDVISFDYPDGKRDAETLLLDPLSKDLYVISKREENVNVYLAPFPQSIKDKITLIKITTLPYGYQGFESSGVVGGDISPDGSEILIKDYFTVYYYERNINETIQKAFDNGHHTIPQYEYDPTTDPQCEAICWAPDASGFYTVSEVRFGVRPHLYYYQRLANQTEVKKKSRGK